MRNVIKQIFKLFAVIFSIILTANVTAQNTIYEVPGIVTKGSVIREYTENIFVVYCTGLVPSFNYVDLSAMTVQSIDMNGVIVKDFEIYHDIVYYCGMDGGTASVGWFDITTAFSGGSPVNKLLIPTITCSEYMGNNHTITDLKKIEVMDIGGWMHLLVTGRARCTHNPNLTDGIFADVYFDGMAWMIEATVDHLGVYYYDDVAVTDNYVIPVGHKNQSNGEYIYQLNKPALPGTALFTANNPLPFPPISSHTIWDYGGYYSYIVDGASEFIIEHITGDYFATACYGKCIPSGGSSYVYGTIFDLYSAVNTVNGRYCVPPYNYIYRDLKYNKYTNSLYLLPGANSTIPNGYLEFSLTPTPTTVTAIQLHNDISTTKYNSLDACIDNYGRGQAILSGYNNSLMLWQHDPPSEKNCTKSVDLLFDKEAYLDFGMFYLDIWYDSRILDITTISPTHSSYDINIICEDEQKKRL